MTKPRIKLKPRTNVLHLVAPAPFRDLGDWLRSKAAAADAGELHEVYMVCKWKGDLVGNGWYANRPDRRVIGEIEMLKAELMAKLK